MNRTRLRRAYHSLWWAPRARSVLRGDLFRRDTLDTTHLHAFPAGGDVIGPVQRDEAIVLFAAVRATRPRTVVEFGFHHGLNAFNLLRALDADARLYSFDIGSESRVIAAKQFGHDERLRFRLKSQAEFEPGDVDGRPVDFVFLDASHDLDLNRETFRRLLPALAPDAIVAVHDTGTIPRELLTPAQLHEIELAWSRRWVRPDVFEHQPGERATLNWLREEHPEFAQINLHTHRVVRWGLTLLQRSRRLETVAG